MQIPSVLPSLWLDDREGRAVAVLLHRLQLNVAFVLGARAPQSGAGPFLRIKTKGATRSWFLLAWIDHSPSEAQRKLV